MEETVLPVPLSGFNCRDLRGNRYFREFVLLLSSPFHIQTPPAPFLIPHRQWESNLHPSRWARTRPGHQRPRTSKRLFHPKVNRNVCHTDRSIVRDARETVPNSDVLSRLSRLREYRTNRPISAYYQGKVEVCRRGGEVDFDTCPKLAFGDNGGSCWGKRILYRNQCKVSAFCAANTGGEWFWKGGSARRC